MHYLMHYFKTCGQSRGQWLLLPSHSSLLCLSCSRSVLWHTSSVPTLDFLICHASLSDLCWAGDLPLLSAQTSEARAQPHSNVPAAGRSLVSSSLCHFFKDLIYGMALKVTLFYRSGTAPWALLWLPMWEVPTELLLFWPPVVSYPSTKRTL